MGVLNLMLCDLSPMQISFFFPGFVIPKPSQLSQWNCSIAHIIYAAKKPASQSYIVTRAWSCFSPCKALQVYFIFGYHTHGLDGGTIQIQKWKGCGAVLDSGSVLFWNFVKYFFIICLLSLIYVRLFFWTSSLA